MMALSRFAVLSFVLWLNSLHLVNALKGDSGCGKYFCVNATVQNDIVTYQLTARKQPVGWLGLGFGRIMTGSDMVVLWRNDDNSITLSQRHATGHTEPKPMENPPLIASLPEIQPASWFDAENSTLSFNIPVNKTHHQPGSNDTLTTLIWAYSMTRPHSSDPDSEIWQHYAAGFLRLDLEKEISGIQDDEASSEQPTKPSEDVNAPSGDSEHDDDHIYTQHDKMVLAHGILVTAGFLFFLPLGSLVARWGRTFTSKWFKVHQTVNFYIGLPVIALGWVLGPVAVFDAKASHFLDSHQVYGLLLFAIYLLQVFLGRYIHNRRAKFAASAKPLPPHPPSNILHVVLGLLTIIFAFYQVRSGMDEFELMTGHDVAHWCHILWKVWGVVLAAAYLAGLALLKRQFRQEESGLSPSTTPKHYLALSPDESTPSALFDAEHDARFELGEDYGESNMSQQEIPKEFESEVPLLKRH